VRGVFQTEVKLDIWRVERIRQGLTEPLDVSSSEDEDEDEDDDRVTAR
jgi:hypothetical protein